MIFYPYWSIWKWILYLCKTQASNFSRKNSNISILRRIDLSIHWRWPVRHWRRRQSDVYNFPCTSRWFPSSISSSHLTAIVDRCHWDYHLNSFCLLATWFLSSRLFTTKRKMLCSDLYIFLWLSLFPINDFKDGACISICLSEFSFSKSFSMQLISNKIDSFLIIFKKQEIVFSR